MAAPWRSIFLEHIAQMNSPTFVLSTIHPKSSTSSGIPYLPRGRTVVYRGTWATLPDNPQNPAPRNPPAYESDLLVVTTDARMDKVPDLLNSGPTRSQGSPSGGGGPVEAVFWATPTKTQWRVRGTAYVLGPDIGSDAPAAKAIREKLFSRMRVLSEPKSATGEAPKGASDARQDASDNSTPSDWSWDREVTAHFGNLSPLMRGSFRNPPPGRPRSTAPEDPRLRLGQRVTDLHDELARSNFRVVVVVPHEVDRVDLSDGEDPRRWLYRYLREGGDDDADAAAGYLEADGSLKGEKHGEWQVLEVWP